MLVVTELSNIAVNDFGEKKSLLVVTELAVSGTQCTSPPTLVSSIFVLLPGQE